MPITPVGLHASVGRSSTEPPFILHALGATSKAAPPTRTSKRPRQLSRIGLVSEAQQTPEDQQEVSSTQPVKRSVTQPEQQLKMEAPEGMWLHRSHCIPRDRLNGWVVSWVLESYLNEDMITKACEKASLQKRLEECGLQVLSDSTSGPRKRCQVLQQATEWRSALLDELGCVRRSQVRRRSTWR